MVALGPVNPILTTVLVELGLGCIGVNGHVDFGPINRSRFQSLTDSQTLYTGQKKLEWIATGRHSGAGWQGGEDSRSVDDGEVVGRVYGGWVDVVGEIACGVGAWNFDTTLAPEAQSSNQGRLCRYLGDLNRNNAGLEVISPCESE